MTAKVAKMTSMATKTVKAVDKNEIVFLVHKRGAKDTTAG